MKGFYCGLIILLSVGLFNCVDNYTKFAKNIVPHYYSIIREYNTLDENQMKDTKNRILYAINDKSLQEEVSDYLEDVKQKDIVEWGRFSNGVTYLLSSSYNKSLDLMFVTFVRMDKVTYDVIPTTVTQRVKKCKHFLFIKKCHYENVPTTITPELSFSQIQEINKIGAELMMQEVRKEYEKYVDSIN